MLAGGLGATIAHFADGDDFTLIADDRSSGFTARARAITGNDYLRLGGEIGAEDRGEQWSLGARVSLQLAF